METDQAFSLLEPRSIEYYPPNIQDDLPEVIRRLGKHFSRAEPRQRAIAYLTGLLSNVPRKNGCNLAAYAQESVPDGMHRLLTTAKWDVDGVRDELRNYVVDRLGCDTAVLAVGQTSFPKKGDHSAGVQRQYSETSRRIENCQIGLFLSYLSPAGHSFIDRELFLPAEWREDGKRCVDAGIKREDFASRADLAFKMVRRAFENSVPNSWVVTSGFGGSADAISEWLETRRIQHVIKIRPAARLNIQVGSRMTEMRAEDILRQASIRRLRSFQVGEAQWLRLPLVLNARADTVRWLIIRRGLNGKRFTYYQAFGKTGTSLLEIAQVAPACSVADHELNLAKTRVGLAEYEARRYEAWYRHVTLALFAHALLGKTV
ncbi:MAG: IS701 family transposase [Actinomycetota bacterium]|nr:IS701 family transposase [Actinomycetota bacterium]